MSMSTLQATEAAAMRLLEHEAQRDAHHAKEA
jgi:hypothetical protein